MKGCARQHWEASRKDLTSARKCETMWKVGRGLPLGPKMRSSGSQHRKRWAPKGHEYDFVMFVPRLSPACVPRPCCCTCTVPDEVFSENWCRDVSRTMLEPTFRCPRPVIFTINYRQRSVGASLRPVYVK